MKAGYYFIAWQSRDTGRWRDLISEEWLAAKTAMKGLSHSIVNPKGVSIEAMCDIEPQSDGRLLFRYGGAHAARNRDSGLFVGDMRIDPETFADAVKIEWRDEGSLKFHSLPVIVTYLPKGGSVDGAARTNPPWTRDQLILALDLYVRHGGNALGPAHPEVMELSDIINQLAIEKGNPDFRNAKGVAMKLMNFRSLDPSFTSTGRVGLKKIGKLDSAVWTEFEGKPLDLAIAAEAIRAGAVSETADEDSDEAKSYSVKEGRVSYRYHRTLERDRKVVALKKSSALREHGSLECEACGFDFVATYGARGHGFIEAHHKNPVHAMQEGDETRPQDLALICSNCHRMIHKSKPWLTIAELRALLSAA